MNVHLVFTSSLAGIRLFPNDAKGNRFSSTSFPYSNYRLFFPLFSPVIAKSCVKIILLNNLIDVFCANRSRKSRRFRPTSREIRTCRGLIKSKSRPRVLTCHLSACSPRYLLGSASRDHSRRRSSIRKREKNPSGAVLASFTPRRKPHPGNVPRDKQRCQRVAISYDRGIFLGSFV